METKTLRRIQGLMKFGYVLSKIAFIFAIVLSSLALVSLLTVAVGERDLLVIGGVSIHSLLSAGADVSYGTMYAQTAVALTLCLGEVFIAAAAKYYFKHELAAGTPFTFEGAREMFRLGIAVIAISLGTVVLADISYAVINENFADVASMHIDGAIQVSTGIAFLLFSQLCKLGAENAQAVASSESTQL